MHAVVSVLEVLLPPACVGCRSRGSLLCAACVAQFRSPSHSEDRFVAPDAGVVIGSHLAVGIGAFAYVGPVRRALAQLKYEGTRRIAPRLARCALEAFHALVAISGPAVLVPVPLHPDRLLARGYNQAGLIAGELGSAAAMPVRELLVRARSPTRQHRLDRAGRLANLRGAIALAPGIAAPRVVIVVDDIITTSATLDACAAALAGGGAELVLGFAVAREV